MILSISNSNFLQLEHSKMPNPKLLVEADGLEAQFRLIPDDDEEEEGQISDDDDDEEEEEQEDDDDDDQKVIGDNINNKNKERINDENNDKKKVDERNSSNNQIEKNKFTTNSKKKRISLFEMQSFLIALILPEPRLSTPPSWCRVLRCMRASNIGIFLLDNVDLDWIENKGSKFTHAFRFEIVPNWIEQLISVPLSRRQQNMTMPAEFGCENGNFQRNLNAIPKISKVELLLSPIQMIVENYPMPYEEHITTLRSRYTEPDDSSPIFAIDCEMCITDRSELTKVSIVDEEMRIVYDELVKPENPITDYLTRYSGITKSMMENVTTTIQDVHSFMRHLPRDAIFCGHSLNNDLSAIQIYHPYVIDTSVIYNRTGYRYHKPSLKSLAFELLGKEIQTSNQVGHDSLEDAITAMELVKLKLVNGILFGDSVAFEQSQGIKYDSKTGITHLQIDKFIERHKIGPLSYRFIDTTPNSRCLYVHDKQEPLDQGVKDAVLYLLEKKTAICVILTNSGECYVKF